MSKSINDKGWNELVIGAALYAFDDKVDYDLSTTQPENREYAETNSKKAYVGDWRNIKPVFNPDTCISCQNCWIFCPDLSIISRDKKIQGIDYEHCKGCGICANVCPTNPKSLIMFDENLPNEEALLQWPEKKKKGV